MSSVHAKRIISFLNTAPSEDELKTVREKLVLIVEIAEKDTDAIAASRELRAWAREAQKMEAENPGLNGDSDTEEPDRNPLHAIKLRKA